MPEVPYPPCPTCGTRAQGQAFSAGREAYCPECRDTFLMTTIGDMRVRFWVCPVGEHRERTDERGGPIVTVEWRGDIAHCTAPECGRTSAAAADEDMWSGSTEPPRECGEHRTTGRRAWCYDCGEWCYPDALCARCELPVLRAEVVRVRAQIAEEYRPLLRVCFAVYDTWMNTVDCYDSGDMPGIASLLGIEGSFAMDAVVDAVEPYEQRIRELLGEPVPLPAQPAHQTRKADT